MTAYTSNNAVLMLDGKTVGTVKRFTMNHSPPDIVTSRDPVTGRTEELIIPSRVMCEATYEATINLAHINDFIGGKIMGVVEWESDGERFLVKGYVNDYKIEGDRITLTLEREKTYEEREAEKILVELRSRGYMQ